MKLVDVAKISFPPHSPELGDGIYHLLFCKCGGKYEAPIKSRLCGRTPANDRQEVV